MRRLMSVRAKSLALEQEGFAGRFGERVGETIDEVEAGRVAALAEDEQGLTGQNRRDRQ